MGFSQKVINFSQKKYYKFLVIGLVAGALLFIVIGAILAISNTTVSPNGLRINNQWVANGGVITMHVFPNQTPQQPEHREFIQITTSPNNQTSHAINLVPSPTAVEFISVTPRISSGDTATLTILRTGENNLPRFHRDTDPDGYVSVVITVDRWAATIRIIVMPYPEMLALNVNLQERDGIGWRNIDYLPLTRYRAERLAGRDTFRFHATLTVLGQSIPNPLFHVQEVLEGMTFPSLIQLFPLTFPDAETEREFQFEISTMFEGHRIVAFFDLIVIE
ncbi:MAG: hypothetical protein FWE31_00545 [Firmicutes bacterium]|nr:hypothetical protein [Bacillota bacterium]